MKNSSFAIAKYTVIESVRNKNLLFLIIGLLLLLGIAEFISEIAITESKEIATAWISFSSRILLVVVLSLFILTSLTREFDDKVMLHIFSHAIKRHTYYTGKLVGYALIGLIAVVILAICLALYIPLKLVIYWCLSFYCELLIVIALSLLFFFTFKQTVISFVSIMSFYILSRNMEIIQLISDSPIIETNTLSYKFINWTLDIIDTVIPSLYDFAQTSWLIYGSFNLNDIFLNMLQCIIYVAFISFVALFDLYRMEF